MMQQRIWQSEERLLVTPPPSVSCDCRLLTTTEFPVWDRFVERHPQASVYHLSTWRHIVAEAFGKQWYVIAILRDGAICAGLPLVHMKSRLFGNFLVSLPYVNYGGVLVDDAGSLETLLERAIGLGNSLGVQHIEFRHLHNYYSDLPVRTEKVSMWRALPSSAEELFASFKSKLRSQIRKGEKNGLGVHIGKEELLEDFYAVFAHNMRDLGTPVYGKVFFRLILEAFPDTARLVVVTADKQGPVAAGLLLGFRDRLEIPWASSLRQFNSLQSNMLLYWNCLKYACQQGYQTFDFGRSTIGSPTYKFKEQWQARPIKHFWHYHLEPGRELPRLTPHDTRFLLATRVWKRLPIGITRWIGPAIVKHLP